MSISVYNHIQSSPSTTWTVLHNLNTTAVNIDVVILTGGVYEKILPDDITTPDNNTVTVTFTSPYSGRARVVGTQIV